MSLSAELARPLPRVPHPFLRKRSALAAEAEKLSQLFGGVPREVEPPENEIARIEAALGEDGSGLGGLCRRDLKVVPYIIWGTTPAWRLNRAFIRHFLARTVSVWPSGTKRLWRHYVLNFAPQCPATHEFGTWLETRVEQLPDLLQTFSRRYSALSPERFGPSLAQAALDGQQLLADIEATGLGIRALRSSALLVTILDEAGRELAASPEIVRPTDSLAALLSGTVENAIAEAAGDRGTKSRALRSLVDGMVAWQEGEGSKGAPPDDVVKFLLALNDDPRFARHRWEGHVSDRSITAVEQWLSQVTIEAFFRVFDTLKISRPDMWKARREFWMSYLPHVSRAWLVVGRDALPIAEREGLSFGQFTQGALTGHCGLMMQIGSVNVMEMNENGKAVFWRAGAKNMPGLYEKTYSRHKFQFRTNSAEVFALVHQGGWQAKFRNLIVQNTGIHVAIG